MAVIKWDPFSLRPWSHWPRWMDEWERTEWPETSRGLRIHETEKEIVAKAVIAGVPSKDVEVKVEDGVLTIRAAAEEEKKKEKRYAAYQYYYTAALSGGQWDKTKAEIEDGVLTVTIPKAKASQPQTVKVVAKKSKK